ncbi:MAG: hypothetical protein HY254_18145 [Burkholderiales bacterium]|nr:hypothetical protein [Burkholderiales bacterium]
MITINDTQSLNMNSTGTQSPHTLPVHLYSRHSDFKRQTMEHLQFSSSISTGASIGMAVGCVLGMINATLAVMISPFFVPGFDLLISEPMVAALTGAAMGIVFGAVIGSLLGWGISSQKFEQLETDLESNASFCPIARTDDQQKLEAWKDLHGDYANI